MTPGADEDHEHEQDPVAEQTPERASRVPTRPAGQERDQRGDGNPGYEELEKHANDEDSHL